MDRNGFSRSTTGHLTAYYCPNRRKIWPWHSPLHFITIFKISVCWGAPRCQSCYIMAAKKQQRFHNHHPNCDSSWKLGIFMTPSVTKHVITIMVHCHCYGVIIVAAASANSRGNWKWGPCYLSSGKRPLVWQRNTLHWPIAYSPKRGWGTCTILGNLFHSSFAIDPSMQREPGARDSTIDAQLNCGTLRCRFPSVCVWLWGLRATLMLLPCTAHSSSYSCVNNLTPLILTSYSVKQSNNQSFYPLR